MACFRGADPTSGEGIRYSGSEQMNPQPLSQAQGNAYALRDRVRQLHPTLSKIAIECAVAFPNVAEVQGHLPTGADPTQVLTFPDLEDCRHAADRLMALPCRHVQ